MTAKENTKAKRSKYILLLAGAFATLLIVAVVIIARHMHSGDIGPMASHTPSVTNLKVCHLTNPLGIDEQAPTFSWQMQSPLRGAMQTAYRITVANSPEALKSGEFCWDSGKVTGDKSVGVIYRGEPLLPKSRYYWQVSIWDENDTLIETAENAWFETGSDVLQGNVKIEGCKGKGKIFIWQP